MGEERTVTETAGEFSYAVRDGEPVADPDWRPCRLVVTTERLVVSTETASQELSHAGVSIADTTALPDEFDLGTAIPLRVGDSVIAVEADENFPPAYARAVLDGTVALVAHPAVVGGVVRETAWAKARLRLDDTRLGLARRDDDPVTLELADIGRAETTTRAVRGDDRRVVEIVHTDGDRSVETHLTGTSQQTNALELLFDRTIEHEEAALLSETERQVLLALYSGVSPFEIPEFVGLDVAEVERIYERLQEVGAVDKIRERTEVALNATGRNMASEAMNDS